MAPIKFGTDGWRAIIARDFTFANCRAVTQGIASYINCSNLGKKGIVIGFDNRFMSEEFARECARVMAGNGIKVILLKKASPTPVTAFAVWEKETGGAIMITASHNPHYYSGIKFIPEYAGPALPDITDVIEKEVNRVLSDGKIYELDLSEAAKLGLYEECEMEREYRSHLLKVIKGEFFSRKPLKVVVNPMFGAGIGWLDQVLADLGCEVRAINNYRDAFFGGNLPEPTESNLSDLRRVVLAYEADLGLALDGDADRFGIIDKNGEFINANRFMSLLLDHLIKTRNFRGPVCRSLATTHMLDRIARKNSLSVIETPVGFKYIGEALRDKACMLGGEESGGLSIFGHIPEKDGILACLLAAEMVAYNGKSLEELSGDLTGEYGMVQSRRTDIEVRSEDKDLILEKIAHYCPKAVAGLKVDSLSRAEGSKIILEDGSWVLVRPSGTEPLFRVYVEAGDKGVMEAIQEEVSRNLGLAD
ncbi:phosphoglucomutase/phosphomannomutase family protein [Syntrophomonas curvata]